MGIHLANVLKTPRKRRKETLAILAFIAIFPLSCVVWFVFLFLACFPPTTVFAFGYFIFIQFYDTAEIDGSRDPFIRNWSWWKHFANYFPVRLHKDSSSCIFNPEKQYIFAYHPHGIIGMGALACNAALFPRSFPNLNIRLLTLPMNFRTPFLRELFLHLGICSASRQSIKTLIGNKLSVMLVVGGAREALDTRPGTNRLTLANRQGFVRMALDSGADLVPVFAFGENDVYETIQGDSYLRKLQNKFQKTFGFSIPLFYGRGVFNYDFGLLPHRRPINVVVGNPIAVQQAPPHLRGKALVTTEEGRELVNKYHSMYIEELTKLYDAHKAKFALHRRESIKFM